MFEPRLAIASLSGESDAGWARAAAEFVGAAFLGGIAVDDDSRRAARAMVADRDRCEFLPADPLAFIDDQLSALADVPVLAGFNVRSATVEPVREVAAICRDRGGVVEVNAHCRQAELCAVGCGERLLADADRLCRYVGVAADTGATVGVKVRAEVPGVDLVATAEAVCEAGAAVLHVDAMDSEPVIAELAELDAFLIANNGVRDRETAFEYLGYGADAVSVGRPSTDPRVLGRVRAAVDEWSVGAGRSTEVDA